MRSKEDRSKDSGEKAAREFRRATRRQYSASERSHTCRACWLVRSSPNSGYRSKRHKIAKTATITLSASTRQLTFVLLSPIVNTNQ